MQTPTPPLARLRGPDGQWYRECPTKATESFGGGLDRRIGADDLEHLDRLAAHVAELVRACWS
jgi:hypothetical protein